MWKYFWMIIGAAAGAALVSLYLRMTPNQKRRLVHMAKQVPYLPARYFV
jgi:hypothetical protein